MEVSKLYFLLQIIFLHIKFELCRVYRPVVVGRSQSCTRYCPFSLVLNIPLRKLDDNNRGDWIIEVVRGVEASAIYTWRDSE